MLLLFLSVLLMLFLVVVLFAAFCSVFPLGEGFYCSFTTSKPRGDGGLVKGGEATTPTRRRGRDDEESRACARTSESLPLEVRA